MTPTQPKLDPEFKAKWVAALRSGEYKQGRGDLLKDGCYCCIGVAAKLYGASDELLNGKNLIGNAYRDVHIEGFPDFLYNVDGEIKVCNTLAGMNDGESGKEPMNFSEIADYIEQNL